MILSWGIATSQPCARVALRRPDPASASATASMVLAELPRLQRVFRWAERLAGHADLASLCDRVEAQARAFDDGSDLTWHIWSLGPSAEFVGEVRAERVAGLPDLVAFHVWVREAHGGRGLAREASAQMFTKLFEEFGVEVIEALAYPSNGPSRRMLLGLGFERWGSVKDHDRYLLFAHQYR